MGSVAPGQRGDATNRGGAGTSGVDPSPRPADNGPCLAGRARLGCARELVCVVAECLASKSTVRSTPGSRPSVRCSARTSPAANSVQPARSYSTVRCSRRLGWVSRRCLVCRPIGVDDRVRRQSPRAHESLHAENDSSISSDVPSRYLPLSSVYAPCEREHDERTACAPKGEDARTVRVLYAAVLGGRYGKCSWPHRAVPRGAGMTLFACISPTSGALRCSVKTTRSG